MLLSPTFEMSKFLVTQINMNDNLKLLQKVTTYKQPLYKKKKKKSNQTQYMTYYHGCQNLFLFVISFHCFT